MTDIQDQLNHLMPAHFLMHTPKEWLEQYPRYLQAINKRLDKNQDNPERDRKNRIEFSNRWQEYLKRANSLRQQDITSAQLNEYRWMLEEYRVSLFAQELKTRLPISAKRLKTYWSEISDA
jgi:ATP-dependent helicase HrpA